MNTLKIDKRTLFFCVVCISILLLDYFTESNLEAEHRFQNQTKTMELKSVITRVNHSSNQSTIHVNNKKILSHLKFVMKFIQKV